ncbi:MAG: SRPBCC domain-containing protein, partial [Brachybacterium alimentarium]
MAITGFLDHDGHDLVLTRSVLAPRSLIWDHLTRSDLLDTWFGTFTGDPTTGRVLVTMTAEPGEDSASEYTIHACEPAELLTVSTSSGEGGWRLSVELVDALGSGTADAA